MKQWKNIFVDYRKKSKSPIRQRTVAISENSELYSYIKK